MLYLLSGQSLALASDRCNGCGRCQEVCPHAVFVVSERQAVIAHREQCMECGACQMNCPVGAITVSSGVGCAAAVINGLRGKGTCCGDGAASCSCD
jgi:NAD-dependent dihydropyrimidine dehydrogenase PreA subunit